MKVGFRTRLLMVLALFAVVPAVVLTVIFAWASTFILQEVSGTEPWEQVAATGLSALDVASRQELSIAERALLEDHRAALSRSLTQASRLSYYISAAPAVAAVLAVLALTLLTLATTRVAGHLSRQLSRPLRELVTWTEMMAKAEPLPEVAVGRGAPEFEVLRQRMRRTARELAWSRERSMEAERLRAMRESARQVAHELKNLLTPIRFAVNRLQRDATPAQQEALEILDLETQRMDTIARSFSQFGKLPEGPPADIDVGEMLTYTARSIVPEHLSLVLSVHPDLPRLRGHHDALSRALANVILNAVEASPPDGEIFVGAHLSTHDRSMVDLVVRDRGAGIPAERIDSIWDPYITHKSGGTGLGLAITRQTVESHGGLVTASSAQGEGTVITLSLPVALPPHPTVSENS
jgi:signal transduction histidine kinase